MEIWKDMLGFEGLYQVSNEGRAKGIDRVIIRKNGRPLFCKGQMLKFKTNKDGYYIVQLSKEKKYLRLVHKLVWETFNGKVPDGLEIGHNDGNNKNNNLDNLYLCTHQQNCNHPITRKRHSEAMKGNTYSKGHVCKYRIPIVCLDLNFNLIKEYDFMTQVKEDGFSVENVSKCCKNTYSNRGNVTKNRIFMTKDNYEKYIQKMLEASNS